jgi:hypothetical protein
VREARASTSSTWMTPYFTAYVWLAPYHSVTTRAQMDQPVENFVPDDIATIEANVYCSR